MSSQRRSPTRWLLASIVIAVLVLATCANAYPFGRGAAVTEVTPASFNEFVNSHKPVVILFYAPWCGHCKNFEPDFIRFAESVKGTVRVGAVNADTHAQLGQQYGVRGFPTIKYWKAGKKNVNAPQEYQGPRTAAALQQMITGDITEENVKANIASVAALESLVRGSPLKRVAALFSRKSKVPAMFSVLSLSRQLQSLPFVFVGGEDDKARAIQSALGVAEVPSVALVSWNETSQSLQLVPYAKKKMLYEPIAKFLLSCVSDPATPDAPLCSAAATSTADSATETGTTQQLDGEYGATGTRPTDTQKRPPKGALAPPAVPVPFTADSLKNFCSPHSVKLGGAAPLCLIFTSPEVTDAALTTLSDSFSRDPVLFFFAKTPEARAEAAAILSDTAQLALDDTDTDAGELTSVFVYRHAREGVVRYARLTQTQNIADQLQKILSGDVRLDTQRLATPSP